MTERLKGKRIAIFIEDYFEDSEILEPRNYLKREGAEVVIVGSGRAPEFTGKRGARIVPDVNIDQIDIQDFDGVIVPGGYAPDMMRRSQEMINALSDADDAGKIVAAVCHGPQLMISANILHDRMVTCFRTVAVDVRNAGAHFIDEPVIVDGNIVTCQSPKDLPQFMNAFTETIVTKDIGSRQRLVAGA